MAATRVYIQNSNPVQDPWQRIATLRIETVATSIETARSTFGPFRCNRFGLAWIVDGGGTTALDQSSIDTRPGTVLLMQPGMVLRHDWGPRRSFQSFIVFDFEDLEPGWPRLSAWPLFRHLDPREFIFSLWRYVIAAEHGDGARSATVHPCVELLLRMFLTGRTAELAATSAVFSEPVERAISFLQARFHARPDTDVKLDQVARHARVSVQHLCRLFKREIGASPMECLRLMRVELAASLLERQGIALAEIAERLGYSSAFHLSRTFKQLYGVTPRDYRTAFNAGLTTRPGGLVFRHHRLRRYLYERAPGKIHI
jgi:AraC family transcriptional regulator